jgi:hypothetical protein
MMSNWAGRGTKTGSFRCVLVFVLLLQLLYTLCNCVDATAVVAARTLTGALAGAATSS